PNLQWETNAELRCRRSIRINDAVARILSERICSLNVGLQERKPIHRPNNVAAVNILQRDGFDHAPRRIRRQNRRPISSSCVNELQLNRAQVTIRRNVNRLNDLVRRSWRISELTTNLHVLVS